MAQDQFVSKEVSLELLWSDAKFTEGPAAAPDGSIYFTSIRTARIMRFEPKTGKTTVYRKDSGKANGLMFDRQGRLVACEGSGHGNIRVSITDKDGTISTLADKFENKRLNSPNDLFITPKGRIYFTDPRYIGHEPRELDFEGVYLVEPDGTLKLATKKLQRPNGILISRDEKTAYTADHHSDNKKNGHLQHHERWNIRQEDHPPRLRGRPRH
jgi:sugar lactone lactonase YvrE